MSAQMVKHAIWRSKLKVLKSLIKVHDFKEDQTESVVGQIMFRWSWWKVCTIFIGIHEDVNDTKSSNVGCSKSMVGKKK